MKRIGDRVVVDLAGKADTPSARCVMNGARTLFAIGDYAAGGIGGAATAAAVRAAVGPGVDLALAMLVGMAVGMLAHLAISLLLSPLLGMFHVMIPGSLIGMYGGMLFAMRDVMQPVSLSQAIGVGVVFGFLVTAGVQLYDRALTSVISSRCGM